MLGNMCADENEYHRFIYESIIALLIAWSVGVVYITLSPIRLNIEFVSSAIFTQNKSAEFRFILLAHSNERLYQNIFTLHDQHDQHKSGIN